MQQDSFLLLPVSLRESIIAGVRKDLREALASEVLLRKQLEALEESIRGYKSFLGSYDDTDLVNESADKVELGKGELPKTQLQWILYVVEQPDKFGFVTCTIRNIVDAMIKANPSFLDKGSVEQWVARISSVLSKTDEVVKMREKGNKKAYHYLSKNWFVREGVIKEEFKEAISDLEPIQ